MKGGTYVKYKGNRGTLKALAKYMLLLGVSYRMVEHIDVGATLKFDYTLGNFALVCALIRVVFEKLVRVKAMRRCGLPGCIFQEFMDEVAIADGYVPKRADVQSGLRLVDGVDANRAKDMDEQVSGSMAAAAEELEEDDIEFDELDLGEFQEDMDVKMRSLRLSSAHAHCCELRPILSSVVSKGALYSVVCMGFFIAGGLEGSMSSVLRAWCGVCERFFLSAFMCAQVRKRDCSQSHCTQTRFSP